MTDKLSTSFLTESKNINGLNEKTWDINDSLAVEPSEISKIFQGATVFITGGTGFLGSLYIEKLIRVAPSLRVYMLLRPKKNKSEEERIHDFLQSPIFDNLKRKGANLSKKIIPISGDIAKPNLGMSLEDIARIIKETNYIIHSAATVRFFDHIRGSTYSNVRSVIDLIAMAKKMTQLKSFLYVSTAFSNCLQRSIGEKFYDPPVSPEMLLNIIDNFSDEELEQITPTLLKGYLNTYLFTKSIAEHVVNTHGRGIPISVVRPSMVVATSKEPLCGWIDNFYLPTGLCVGIALGLIRALPFDSSGVVNIIPADFVVNCGIAALWKSQKEPNEIKVYNCISSTRQPINMHIFSIHCLNQCEQIPPIKAIWPAGLIYTNSKYYYAFLEFLYQTLPVHLVDLYLRCRGKTPFAVEKLKRAKTMYELMNTVVLAKPDFLDSNVEDLCQELSDVDKEKFNFNVKTLDWEVYLKTYCKGMRVYLLNDPMTTVEAALKKYKKLKALRYTLIAVFWLAVLYFGLIHSVF